MDQTAQYRSIAESVLKNDHMNKIEKKNKFLDNVIKFVEMGGSKNDSIVDVAKSLYGLEIANPYASITDCLVEMEDSSNRMIKTEVISDLSPELQSLIDNTEEELDQQKYLRRTLFPLVELRAFDHINGLVTFVSCYCDLRLPVEDNKLHTAMMKDGNMQAFVKKVVKPNTNEYFLVLGSRGCGKTSLLFAVAKEKYSIYIQGCVDHRYLSIDNHFANEEWASYSTLTTLQITQLYYRELMCRLLELNYMLTYDSAKMTPLQWLLAFASRSNVESFNRILIKSKINITKEIIEEMFESLKQRIGYYPLILLDDVETLQVKDAQNIPLMETIRNAQFSFKFCTTVVWSGTDMDNFIPRIANYVIPTGRFELFASLHYLTTNEVRSMLLNYFPSLIHELGNKALDHMIHKLQGRPKFMARFIEKIIRSQDEEFKTSFKVAISQSFECLCYEID